MSSDSDDDSQISQPHLMQRLQRLQQTVAEDDESEHLDGLGESFRSQSLGSDQELPQKDSIEQAFEDRGQQTSPQSYPWTSNRFLSSTFDQQQLQKLLAQLDSQPSPSTSPRPGSAFISRHLQNWASQLPIVDFETCSMDQSISGSVRRQWQRTRFHFQMNEELFYKIKKLFPTLDKEKIRDLLYLHDNKEHEIIAAAINCLKPKQIHYNVRRHRELHTECLSEEQFERLRNIDEYFVRQQQDPACMKLRYLKYLYPEADLLLMYDLLHNLDYKANLVAERLEEMGLKRVTEESVASAQLSSSLSSIPAQLHIGLEEISLPIHEKEQFVTLLQQEHSDVDERLIRMALKCTNYNMNLARQLLASTDLHPEPCLEEQVFLDEWKAEDWIPVITRGTQTLALIDYDFGGIRKILKSSTPIAKKVNASTDTNDLKDPFLLENVRPSLAQGPQPILHSGRKILAKGPSEPVYGAQWNNHQGPNPALVFGADQKLSLGPDPNLRLSTKCKQKAIGPDPTFCSGPNKNFLSRILDEDIQIN